MTIIIPPTPKDLLNLELWAIRNNLYIHPAYLRASKVRNRLVVMFSAIGGAFITVLLIELLNIIFHAR